MPRLRRHDPWNWWGTAVTLPVIAGTLIGVLPARWPSSLLLTGGALVVLLLVGWTLAESGVILAIVFVMTMLLQPSIVPDHSRRNKRVELVRVVRDRSPSNPAPPAP